MWGFSRCDGCPFVNYGGGGGLCDCINPMSDWSGLLMAKHVISRGPEDDARMARIEEERHLAYQRNLETLYPSEAERTEFLEKPRMELGGLSIEEMREKMPYGIEVAMDVVAYLAGKREGGGGWDRWFSNAVGGYFFLDERESWLDSPNELLGGKSNRDIAQGGGYRVLTEILWFLLLANPAGKEAPMFTKPKPISRGEEEMLLDEFFPESVGQVYYSRLAADEARQRGKAFLFASALAVFSVAGYTLFRWLFG